MSAIFGGSTKISSGINAVVDILSGDVITVSSGLNVVVESGIFLASGTSIAVESGIGVTVNSGVGVTVNSGLGVTINSGATVLIGSGTFMGAVSVSGIVTSRMQAINYLGNFVNLQTNKSGDTGIQVASSGFSTITITSGVNIINDSGFGVITSISGNKIQIADASNVTVGGFIAPTTATYTASNGMVVAASLYAQDFTNTQRRVQVATSGLTALSVASSGQGTITITSGANILNRDAVPTTGRGRAVLVLNNSSGGTILSSGDVIVATIKAPRTNSGDVYVGFDVAGERPYSGYGMTLLEPGNVITFDIDNLNRIRVFSTVSGFTQIVYGGIQY